VMKTTTNTTHTDRHFFRDVTIAGATHRIYSTHRNGVRVWFCETLGQEWSGAMETLRWVQAQGGRIHTLG